MVRHSDKGTKLGVSYLSARYNLSLHVCQVNKHFVSVFFQYLRQHPSHLSSLVSMPFLTIPRILTPECTWPRPIQTIIAAETPPTPRVSSQFIRRLWGHVHRLLARFSGSYSDWFKIRKETAIFELPFGLILKWSERTSIEEAVAMQMARAAGMPVPKMLCYGEHSSDFKISILMTRLPGEELLTLDGDFNAEEEQPWFGDLEKCMSAMRKWKNPFGEEKVCSAIGTQIHSRRVPRHVMGPFEDKKKLHEYLLSASSSHAFKSLEEYQATTIEARKIINMDHRIVFTHGDLKAHNVLIDDKLRLTGFLDWETAGWCPEYWDFTTAVRFSRDDSWWSQGISILSGDSYKSELKYDRALNKLTVDSYIGM